MPLVYCREPTCLQPIVKCHKETKASLNRQKATKALAKAEELKAKEAKLLADRRQEITLVPEWDAEELLVHEIRSKSKSSSGSDTADSVNACGDCTKLTQDKTSHSVDVELSAYDMARLERRRMNSNEKERTKSTTTFKRRTVERVNA